MAFILRLGCYEKALNLFGNSDGAIAPIVVGYGVARFNSWAWPFYVMAGVFAFGVVMWLLVDPQRSVLENELPT